jgi:hypothetical protein
MPHLIKQRQIEGGVGGGVGGAFAKYTPTLIPSGESFIVPENTQVLWAVSIHIDGALHVDGAFIQVS